MVSGLHSSRKCNKVNPRCSTGFRFDLGSCHLCAALRFKQRLYPFVSFCPLQDSKVAPCALHASITLSGASHRAVLHVPCDLHRFTFSCGMRVILAFHFPFNEVCVPHFAFHCISRYACLVLHFIFHSMRYACLILHFIASRGTLASFCISFSIQ